MALLSSLKLCLRRPAVISPIAKCQWNRGQLHLTCGRSSASDSTPPKKSILDHAPQKFVPYLKLIRFDKPIGTWLLFIPGAWSIALAAPAQELPSLKLLALFGIGSVLMRGAGCTINDMWDVEFDKKVERTRTRPLASGDITHRQAMGFLTLQLTGALGVLLSLNYFCFPLAALSLVPVALYPLAKRVTYWPQVVLGLTFNWGALLGWAAVHGSLDLSTVLPLYAACICWTVVYDTIYAHQDKKDDVVAGVKSTALLFGERSRVILNGFSAATLGFLAVAGYNTGQTYPYYVALCLAYGHLLNQVNSVDWNNPGDCSEKFVSNTQIGRILFVGIVLGTLLKAKSESHDSDEGS